MSAQRQTISNFKGMSNGQTSGEFFYAENLKPGQFGLDASLYLSGMTASGNPGRLNWLVEFLNSPWGVATDGKVYKYTSEDWTLARTNSQTTQGNGLIVDQKGRLLYAGQQYLGMASDASTFTDNWKDLTDAVTGYRPLATYEDWVVIGGGSKVKVMSVLDDVVADGLTLPTGFHAQCISVNKTGILIGANVSNRGVLILWRVGYTRSLNEWIWLDAPVQSICKAGDGGWIVTTSQEQFATDGYNITSYIPALPDTVVGLQPFSVVPQGTFFSDSKLYTLNADLSGRYNRHKSGLWIYDVKTEKHLFVPGAATAEVTAGALFKTSSAQVIASYTTSSTHRVALLREDIAPNAVLIAGPFGTGATKKTATAASLGLSVGSNISAVQKTKSFTVTAKVANLKRTLWGYGVTSATSDSATTLKVNGQAAGFSNAKVGDEVTILSGSDAGQVRHITAIANEDATTEVWTLDSALSGTTASGIYLQVMPFQKIDSKTISFTTLDELEDQFFNISNKIQGKKFLLKFVFSSISSFPITIDHVALDYDDKETVA